jgi:DNA-binding CsgD family transcriptional regulator
LNKTAADAGTHQHGGATLGLLERDQELDTIRDALDAAAVDRRGRTVLIEAPWGVGKSSLLAAATELARARGMRMLRAQGRELERDFAYGVVTQLLELGAATSDAAGELVRQLHTAGNTGMGDDAPLQSLGYRFDITHNVFSLIRELADERGARPLTVIVDDLEWVDRPSLLVLAYLAARVDSLPLTLLIAVGSTGTVADPRALAALRRAADRGLLRLATLSPEAVTRLVRRELPAGGAEAETAFADATGGNPFLVAELLREVRRRDRWDGPLTRDALAQLAPERVVDRVSERLAALPVDAAAVARAMAVLGDGAQLRQAAAVAEVDPAPRLFEALAAAELFAPGAPLSFVCPLLARCVRASMSDLEQGELRRRSAVALSAEGVVEPFGGPPAPITPAQRFAIADLAIEGGVRGEPRERVAELAQRAWQRGALLEGERASETAARLGGALVFVDELERSLEIGQALAANAPDGWTAAGSWRAWALYHQGRVTDAASEVESLLDGGHPEALGGFGALAAMAACHLTGGRLDAADDALSILSRAPEIDDRDLPALLEVQAELRLAQMRPAEAAESALEAGRRCHSTVGVAHPGILPWRSTAALAQLALDEPDEARRLAKDELELARRADAPRAIIRSLRVLGLAERGARGLRHLAEAVEIGDASPVRLEFMHALFDFGGALRRANQRASARKPLQRALELSLRGGALALSARCHDELIAAGGRPRRAMTTGVEALTPSERRVADLAAEGQTTRQIANALFVTPKTVEFHLRNVYRKLDVPSSRAELGRALRGSRADGNEAQ